MSGRAVTAVPTKAKRVTQPRMSEDAASVVVRVWLPGGLGVSPNERVHWAQRSRRNANVRAAAAAAAFAIRPRKPLDRVTVELEVVWPYRARQRDDDNLLTMCKPIIDGLADGQVIVSDAPGHATLMPPVQSRDKDARIPVVIARIHTNKEANP